MVLCETVDRRNKLGKEGVKYLDVGRVDGVIEEHEVAGQEIGQSSWLLLGILLLLLFLMAVLNQILVEVLPCSLDLREDGIHGGFPPLQEVWKLVLDTLIIAKASLIVSVPFLRLRA